jgi:hypothetical protein
MAIVFGNLDRDVKQDNNTSWTVVNGQVQFNKSIGYDSPLAGNTLFVVGVITRRVIGGSCIPYQAVIPTIASASPVTFNDTGEPNSKLAFFLFPDKTFYSTDTIQILCSGSTPDDAVVFWWMVTGVNTVAVPTTASFSSGTGNGIYIPMTSTINYGLLSLVMYNSPYEIVGEHWTEHQGTLPVVYPFPGTSKGSGFQSGIENSWLQPVPYMGYDSITHMYGGYSASIADQGGSYTYRHSWANTNSYPQTMKMIGLIVPYLGTTDQFVSESTTLSITDSSSKANPTAVAASDTYTVSISEVEGWSGSAGLQAVEGGYITPNHLNNLTSIGNGNYIITGFVVGPSSPVDNKVQITAGTYAFNGTEGSKASQTVTISANNTASPRRDVIVIDSTGVASTIAGTPAVLSPVGSHGDYAQTPTTANIPDEYTWIGEVWIPENTASPLVTWGSLWDRRVICKVSRVTMIGSPDTILVNTSGYKTWTAVDCSASVSSSAKAVILGVRFWGTVATGKIAGLRINQSGTGTYNHFASGSSTQNVELSGDIVVKLTSALKFSYTTTADSTNCNIEIVLKGYIT